MKQNWIIISFEHSFPNDEGLTFWRANAQGYTVYFSAAGRYTKEEAEKICKEANYSEVDEVAIHVEDAQKLAEKTSDNGEHIALTQEQLAGMQKTGILEFLWPLPKKAS